MALRYRYHGRFIDAATARRLGNLKNTAKHIRTETVAKSGLKTTKSVPGYKQTAAEVRSAKKLPAKPVAKPTKPAPAPPKPPVPVKPAAPSPPPPRERRRITPEERFERSADEFEAMLEDVGGSPDEEELDDLNTQWRHTRELFDDIDEPSDGASAYYDGLAERWQDLTGVAPDAEDWDRELFGYDPIPGEADIFDELLDYFDVLDVDEDKYAGGK